MKKIIGRIKELDIGEVWMVVGLFFILVCDIGVIVGVFYAPYLLLCKTIAPSDLVIPSIIAMVQTSSSTLFH